jgi:DNA-binding ferritin-like protein
MRTRVVTVRNDAKKIYKELKKEKLTAKEIDDLTEGLRNIAERISIWGQSTFGELQTYFEDAYLKIIEAKLLRNRDLIRSMSKINEAIIIYHRVKHLLQERLEETEDLKEEEKLMNDKERDLFEKCSKSLDATVKLREEIESIFKQLSQKGILREDLMKISELTLEYSVNLYKIMEDTFGTDNKTKKAIQDILKKIDEIFENYDQWKEDDFTVF